MSLGQRLDLRQGQSLVMTPQLQQAIKLLQLSNLDLSAYVESELERNPLLDRDDGPDPGEAEPPSGEASSDGPGELDLSDASSEAAQDAIDADFESLHADARSDDPSEAPADGGGAVDWSRAGSGQGGGEDRDFDAQAPQKTLREHLSEQLTLAAHDPIDRMIGAQLVEMVEDDGYWRGDIGETAERLGVDCGRVEAILTLCQSFEPAGVMARDLKECLALQLRDRDRFDPAMAALVDNLELLAKHDLKRLQVLCGVDAEDMADMIAELRALTPKPGFAFGGEAAQSVAPDVFVRPSPDGSWMVELTTDTLPRVLVNTRYYATVAQAAHTDAEKTFISECHQNASWLVKSLDQRARTILKVAREIVRQQDAFLTYGVRHLRPLNLKVIAEAIGMHESTVSRVTSNKYMATPRGLFELKYFFTSAVPAAGGGEAHSAEAVRDRIKTLIDQETADAVLSDDRIVELLREAGVESARRTVAKYRDALKIPSSVQRRRLLKAVS
ncbi:MAG: RNA polymerase factor sigma-54 [Maricaulaceae bacterium]